MVCAALACDAPSWNDGFVQSATFRDIRVNERTKEFARLHPDLDKLPEAARAELKLLRDEQNRVLELFRELTTDAKAPGGKP